eukprot:8921208-Lingulodinium_polyedra.AAC.1
MHYMHYALCSMRYAVFSIYVASLDVNLTINGRTACTALAVCRSSAVFKSRRVRGRLGNSVGQR